MPGIHKWVFSADNIRIRVQNSKYRTRSILSTSEFVVAGKGVGCLAQLIAQKPLTHIEIGCTFVAQVCTNSL